MGYTYADGSNNDKRTLSVIYPDLREIDFDYGATGSDDDLLSRFGGLEDAGGSLVKYTYFGVDTFCEQEYPENAVKLTYIDSSATGDPYTGLDRFGRVIDQRWHKGGSDLERLEYAYSRVGNRTERKNTEGSDQDEKYTYDGLYRLDDMERGTLNNGSITDKKFAQDWGYDALGNWDTFKQDDDGNGWDLNQTRAYTKANEIEEIDSDSGVISHDPAGNITKSPVPGNWGVTYDYVWDAWNRLVRIISGRANRAVFRYDGQHKRITKTADSIIRHFYYSVDWQILEERLDEETEPVRQYVWNPNPGSMDDLILRDESFDGSGSGSSSSSSSSSGGQQRLYALNDLMNVTAIVDDDGNVVERYGYTPFGESRVMDAGFGSRTSSDYDWELRYKTYPLDLESGLYQVRFRYLHPGLGRWMSRDPIGYEGGTNLYRFVDGNPMKFVDPLGLVSIDCINTGDFRVTSETTKRRISTGSLYEDIKDWLFGDEVFVNGLILTCECERCCTFEGFSSHGIDDGSYVSWQEIFQKEFEYKTYYDYLLVRIFAFGHLNALGYVALNEKTGGDESEAMAMLANRAGMDMGRFLAELGAKSQEEWEQERRKDIEEFREKCEVECKDRKGNTVII